MRQGETHPGSRRRWAGPAGFLLACVAAQIIAGLLTSISVNDWYPTLRKPVWTPPGWLFGPVWTYLYLSMGVAAWLVWERRNEHNIQTAMTLFAAQLLLNVMWSGLFFGLRMPMIAFWELTLLWIAILGTLMSFWRIRRLSGLLMLPYLLWVAYASAINLAIWRLNS